MFVGVCVCDTEYFMVKERVNSYQRQMWSHPSKAGDKKLFRQELRIRPEQSRTFLKKTDVGVADEKEAATCKWGKDTVVSCIRWHCRLIISSCTK